MSICQRWRSSSMHPTLFGYQKVRFLLLVWCFQDQDVRCRKNKQRRTVMHASFTIITALISLFVHFLFLVVLSLFLIVILPVSIMFASVLKKSYKNYMSVPHSSIDRTCIFEYILGWRSTKTILTTTTTNTSERPQ